MELLKPAHRMTGTGFLPSPGRMPLPLLLLLIGINLLWAGSSLAAKIALHSIPPITLAFARFSLAAILMYGLALLRRVDLRVARRDWGKFWAMGILGIAMTYLLSYAGIERTSASSSSLIIAMEPVYLGILAFVFLRERLYTLKVVGIIAGLSGAYLIVAQGWRLPTFAGMTLGDILIAVGLVFEAGSSIVGKGLVARYPAVSVITYQMTGGAIALAPFATWEFIRSGHSLTLPPAPALWSLIYLTLPCTVFAYTIWFTVLDKREASEMSVFLFVQPIAGAFLGMYFLGDKVTSITIAGAMLVLLGIALVNRRPDIAPAPPAA